MFSLKAKFETVNFIFEFTVRFLLDYIIYQVVV